MRDPQPEATPTAWPTLPEPYSLDEFLDLIAEVGRLPRDKLHPGVTLEELNIASLDMVEILFAIEERFGVYVPMGDELYKVVHLADLIAMLSDLIRSGGAADTPAA